MKVLMKTITVYVLLLALLVRHVDGFKIGATSEKQLLNREDLGGFLEKGRSASVEESALGRLVFYPTTLESFGADGLLYLRSSVASFLGNQSKVTKISEVKDEVKELAAGPNQQMYFRPVSVTLKCVMMLTITSLLLYTAVSIARNSDELNAAFTPSAATQALTIASRVGTFAPMMCMLFVSCRMYVLATTEGLGEPPAWVKNCMYIGVAGFAVQLCLVLLLPQFVKMAAKDEASYDMTMGKQAEVTQKSADAQQRKAEERSHVSSQSASSSGEYEESADDEAGLTEKHTVADATGDSNDVHPALSKLDFAEEYLCISGASGLQAGKIDGYYERDGMYNEKPLWKKGDVRMALFKDKKWHVADQTSLENENPRGNYMVQSGGSKKVGDLSPTLVEAWEDNKEVSVEFYKDEAGAQVKRTVFWVLQFVSIVLIYGGVFGVIIGIVTFPAQSTKISPAVQCTVLLSGVYFSVCILLWIARALPGAENEQGYRSGLTDAALSMTNATRKAPMFAVLFLASRMRALNLDPPYGMPPFWMQCCFYSITALVYVETIVAAIIGYTGRCDKGYYGVYIFRGASKSLVFLQQFTALITYVMLFPIIHGVIQMTYADGTAAPLSTTLRCVVALQSVYFSVMAWQSITFIAEAAFLTDKEVHKGGYQVNRTASLGAGVSMTLAPILSILFVATRMRALQITQQKGEPPGWSQDCMDIAVFACCIQALCCLLLPIFLQTEVDEDGNPDYSNSPMVAAYALAVLKYVMLIALHSSVIAVCCAVYVMTPETANNNPDNRMIKDDKDLFKGLAITMGIFFIALLFSSAKVIGMGIKMAIMAADEIVLGVNIDVKNVALNLFQGYVKIHDFVILQPEYKIHWSRDKEGKLQKEDVKDNEGNKVKNVWTNDFIAKIHMVILKLDVWRVITTLGKEFDIANLTVNGIWANVEKPSLNTKNMDSNVDYITCHLEETGLTPPPEQPGRKDSSASNETKKEEPKKPEPKKEEPKKPDPKKPDDKKDEKKEEAFIPKVIMHKLCFGDFGARVLLSQERPFKVRFPFKISIGEINITDVQHDVFNDKEDLTPGQMVGCIVKALAKAILNELTHKLPEQIARAGKEKAKHVVEAVSHVGHKAVDQAKKCNMQ